MEVGKNGAEVFYPNIGRTELLPGELWEISREGDVVAIGITARDGWRHWAAVPLSDFLKYIAAADDSIGEVIDPGKGAPV